MNLALVIPVRNDQLGLDRLVAQARFMGVFAQIVVVDDASEVPVSVAGDIIGPRRCPVTVLRRDARGGAGTARNLALGMVQTDHMIFFDSDDLFTPEFAPLWESLQGRDFDFCLMRYQDSERAHFGGWGQNPHDEACWKRAEAGNDVLSEPSETALWTLAQAGNFPWNKIYRTAFLRDNGLRCTETQVHNDIELHWGSFLAARRVILSARIGALHVVRPGADRLTNISDATRLQLFQALNRVLETLAQHGNPLPATLSFLRFAADLLIWAERMIDADLRDAFRTRTQIFLQSAVTAQIHETLIHEDPVLALQLCLQRSAEPVPC
ncbi:glycosyltransferase [Roseovarius sp. Pro17]|uniref:glycosyltransferase n=1 Tax=Roseovarius sp. Pro17 TaxID=3108175 RepID=UPI002D78069C|nr:glycosyltransferase [Roseovarius sp. Pro17]